MTSFNLDDKFIAELQQTVKFRKYPMPGASKDTVLQNIHAALGAKSDRRQKQSFWRKRIVSVTAAVVFACVGTWTVAWANGINVLDIVVHFVHNITKGGAFGTGYSLENTTVSLTLKGNSSSKASSTSSIVGTQSSTVTPAHALDSTQMMPDGGLFDTGYNTQLDSYLGTKQYPKLMVNNLVIKNIQAYSIDRSNDIFYMYVSGYVPKSDAQTVNLGVYHKTGGNVVIDGQTLSNIKQKVDIFGIDATYVSFTNKKSFLNYLTWKSGNWIFVLRSNNVPEKSLITYAQGLESQVKAIG